MLWVGDVTYWAGWPERRVETVLNTTKMSMLRDLTTIALTGTRFLYSEWTEHRTGDLRVVEVDDTLANVKLAFGAPAMDYFDVGVYPNDDINETPITYTFKAEDVDRVIQANQDRYPGCCWMWLVHNETKRKRYLIDIRLPGTFVDLVETGSTTTTTTSTDRQD